MGNKDRSIKEMTHKQAIKIMKSRGFYIIDKIEGDKKGTIAKRMSYVRFGHKGMDGYNLLFGSNRAFIPELIFYYDASDSSSFFFNFGISLMGTKRKAFIPFFGKFTTAIREVKSSKKFFEALSIFFELYHDFVTYVSQLRNTKIDSFLKKHVLKSLISMRFHSYFISNGKEIDLEETDIGQFTSNVISIDQNESIFDIYTKFVVSNTCDDLFSPQVVILRDKKTKDFSRCTTRSIISNTYKARQFFELCSNTLFQIQEEEKNKYKQCNYQAIAA